jgi:hypothetical protein
VERNFRCEDGYRYNDEKWSTIPDWYWKLMYFNNVPNCSTYQKLALNLMMMVSYMPKPWSFYWEDLFRLMDNESLMYFNNVPNCSTHQQFPILGKLMQRLFLDVHNGMQCWRFYEC